MNLTKLFSLAALTLALAVGASAQIPDLINALDAGGRAMGIGGATYLTDATTNSALLNPAGLGFINQSTFSASYRNLPESRNTISGDFNDPDFTTKFESGGFGLTHVGYAFPMGHGSLGISYTRGGFIRDERTGDFLADGTLTIRNYEEVFRSQTDLFTVSYGATSGGTTNYGLGVVIANQYILNRQNYDIFDGSNPVGSVSADNSGTGLGVGLVAGLMVAPNSHSSLGVSAQSPIDLQGNSETQAYYDRIPGRLSAGFANRNDKANGSYVLYGLSANWYFGGQKNKVFPRDSYATISGGIEYCLVRWNARIPLRIGYAAMPSGGDGFIDRDVITFGIGYRPNGSDFSLDLSFARPVDGNTLDFALSITRTLGK